MADEPVQPQAEAAPPGEAAESWNPLKTPVSLAILLVQVGLAIAAIRYSVGMGSDFDNIGMWSHWFERNHLTFDVMKLGSQPWRILTCLFVEKIPIMVVLNVVMWASSGPQLEKIFKPARLLFLYVATGLACMLLCEELSHHFAWIATTGRSGARHAAIGCSGSVLGLLVAIEGPWKTLKSRPFWSLLFSIGLMFAISKGLETQGRSSPLDWMGVVVDIVLGSVVGGALALTLLRGPRKTMGFILCAILSFGIGAATLAQGIEIRRSDKAGFKGNTETEGSKETDASKPSRPADARRLPEEAATPKPTLPGEDDPPEIAKMRAKANELLEGYGALPQPVGDPDEQHSVRKRYQELKDFDDRWTKSASANLEAEMAELSLIANDRDTAETVATKALALMESGLTPTKAQGSVTAKRIARLHGVLGTVYWKNGDEIAAANQFRQAGQWDPLLADVHYFLGKIGNDKNELKLFLDRAGPSPPDWQKDRVRDAKMLLGN